MFGLQDLKLRGCRGAVMALSIAGLLRIQEVGDASLSVSVGFCWMFGPRRPWLKVPLDPRPQ